jgi:hypothetical protein
MKLLLFALPLAGLGFGVPLAPGPTATITVRNPLAPARPFETISLPLTQLPAAVH